MFSIRFSTLSFLKCYCLCGLFWRIEGCNFLHFKDRKRSQLVHAPINGTEEEVSDLNLQLPALVADLHLGFEEFELAEAAWYLRRLLKLVQLVLEDVQDAHQLLVVLHYEVNCCLITKDQREAVPGVEHGVREEELSTSCRLS